MNPLPITRKLSTMRETRKGPNGHWLSRRSSTLNGAKQRALMVNELKELPPEVWK